VAKFDAVAHVYDASRGGLDRGVYVADQLRAFLPGGTRLLELGVGTGAVAMALMEAGYDVVGVDISAPMLASARPRLPGRVGLADAAALPFVDGVFDAVYAVWVMYHLVDPRKALAEAARVLRPGGRLLALDRSRIDGGVDIWGELAREVERRLGRKPPALSSGYEDLAQVAESQGLRKVGIMAVSPWRDRRTLRQAIDNTRQRVFGWDGTEDDWVGVVEPLLDEWSRRPDVDDVVIFEQGHEVLVLDRS